MEADRWRRIERLFQGAREVPPDEREAFLRDRCEDPAVREEVVSLLSAREEAPAFFEAAAREVVAPMLDDVDEAGGQTGEAPDVSGQKIGPYRLEEQIGVGGMSVVYRATRAEADFEQTVAMKLLHRRLHGTEAADRFRAERQLLARLDHPNVAQLIDGGVTESGWPYLVMEYVEGVPITSFVEERELDLEARLALLDQVFDAVEVAHRQLVVHRDLKPSNVLVAEAEEGPRVKLLDFGIAKLLDDSMPVTRPQTRTGQQLMTPAYAAPEQVTGSEEVNTATDVYQLGVLAYELLAGARPFDLSDASLTEVERVLLEEEPQKPSEVAEAGAGQLRGDLDTIVLKALRKDPDRRYGSVEALAADVERYRSGEPVQARPTAFAYRAKKFVNRNRTVVGAAVLIFLLGVAYAVTVTIQANRLAEQRDRAQREAETAEEVSEMLVGTFEASDPYNEPDTLTARMLLQRGEDRISELDDQPAAQAQLLGAMGRAHQGLGDYDRADSLQEVALEVRKRLYDAPHPQIATSLNDYGEVQGERGRYAVAESLHMEALTMQRRLYDGPDSKIAETLVDLGQVLYRQSKYEAADSVYRDALSIQREELGRDDPTTAQTINNLGAVLDEQGKYEAAESLYRKALAIQRDQLGAQHPITTETLNNLGVALDNQGEWAAADSIYRKVLAIRRNRLGPRHPSTATALYNLATAVRKEGNYAAADSIYREVLAIDRAQLGPRHPNVASTLSDLGLVLRKRGKYAASDSVQREALAIRRQKLGPNHPRTANSLNQLGLVLRDQGKYAAADSVFREAVAIRRDQLGPRHPSTAITLYNLALLLLDQAEYAAADSVFRKVVAIEREQLGPRHPSFSVTLTKWGNARRGRGDYAAADSIYREALSIQQEHFGAEHPRVADTHRGLGHLHQEQGQYAAAERHFRKSLTIRRSAYEKGHPDIRASLEDLVDLYSAWEKPTRAQSYRDSLVENQSSPSGS